uniref:Uncharacterized protein n=1 Tax=viral metagenome TaxID=1070528 RepID=A0A6C0B3V6_9ZZZZ
MDSISRILQTVLNPPPPLNDEAYSGYYYAYYGDGGFSTDQSFNPISLSSQAANSFQLYDVTYAVQVKFDVRTINQKLGLIKDASNVSIVESTYRALSNSFPIDSISVSADEFIQGMSAGQVISVGVYQKLYQDYIMAVNKYFYNYGSLNDGLFSNASMLDISNGLFDANQFMNLIYQEQDPNQNQNYAVPLTGFVTLSNINQLLRYSVDSNVFGNRVPLPNDPSVNITPLDVSINNTIVFTDGTVTDVSENSVTTTVVDPNTNITTITIQDNDTNSTTVETIDTVSGTNNIVTTDGSGNTEFNTGPFTNPVQPSYADVSFSQIPANYGVADGFLAGDLIFIPAGLSVLVETVVDPQIDASSSFIYDLIVNSGLAYQYAIDLSNIATQKTTIINKMLTAPLLIELANLS